MIFSLNAVGNYVWSTSNEDHLKVWIKPSSKDIHCIAVVPLECKELRIITAATHGESIYCQSGTPSDEGTFDIYEFSPTGKLLTLLKTTHKTFITAMGWSQSPDRLWTADMDGIVCCHELKLGKKTMERLRAESDGNLMQIPAKPITEAERSGSLKKAWRVSRVPSDFKNERRDSLFSKRERPSDGN